MKRVLGVHKKPAMHWVGDGFAVSSIFSYHNFAEALSPFLLLDYAEPREFPAAKKPRGVETHPHRGFETVTIVFSGGLEHRDSAGNHGSIGAGDVQWMTAASGVLHEEKHSADFTKRGGTFEVAQLWVNLPSRHKMSAPGYQTLLAAEIATVAIPGGTVRVIAGEFNGQKGAARTFTPVNLWDLTLAEGWEERLNIGSGQTAAIFVMRGRASANSATVSFGELAVFEREGEGVSIAALEDSRVLIMSAEPINEPVVGHGPFVMNTQTEIDRALEDYRRGCFGNMKNTSA
ncbi:MAG: pirin family protein [Deltaproteobacteria bacterium]